LQLILRLYETLKEEFGLAAFTKVEEKYGTCYVRIEKMIVKNHPYVSFDLSGPHHDLLKDGEASVLFIYMDMLTNRLLFYIYTNAKKYYAWIEDYKMVTVDTTTSMIPFVITLSSQGEEEITNESGACPIIIREAVLLETLAGLFSCINNFMNRFIFLPVLSSGRRLSELAVKEMLTHTLTNTPPLFGYSSSDGTLQLIPELRFQLILGQPFYSLTQLENLFTK
jgi:hypothetical protein